VKEQMEEDKKESGKELYEVGEAKVETKECDLLNDSVRNRILLSTPDLIGRLELLSILKEKADSRTTEERSEYSQRFEQPGIFTLEAIKRTHQKIVKDRDNGELKSEAYKWMKKYTCNVKNALSVTAFAVLTVLYLRDRISPEGFHESNHGKGGYKRSYEQFFEGTDFSHIVEMLTEAHLITTKGGQLKLIEINP
jgi:hypothetical protein